MVKDTEFVIDREAAYRVAGYDGIAFRIDGFVKTRDEDYEWTGIEDIDTTKLEMHMIGDDRIFIVDVDDVTEIPDEDYCPECGQIGCKAYG